MKDTYTFQEFCSDRGITPEWLTSKEGNLTIGSETQRLPDDELIVGGNLEIVNESLTRLPERVIVAGYYLLHEYSSHSRRLPLQ